MYQVLCHVLRTEVSHRLFQGEGLVEATDTRALTVQNNTENEQGSLEAGARARECFLERG